MLSGMNFRNRRSLIFLSVTEGVEDQLHTARDAQAAVPRIRIVGAFGRSGPGILRLLTKVCFALFRRTAAVVLDNDFQRLRLLPVDSELQLRRPIETGRVSYNPV